MRLFPIILSGGSGTRLWPVSRELFPKQLVSLTGDNSLFQQTLQRCQLLQNTLALEVSNPVVVCNEQHRFLIAQQAQEAGIELGGLILEPEAKNTAPALTIAAEYINQTYGEGLMLVLAADHAIESPMQFATAVGVLSNYAMSELSIGVFGIHPTCPHTGYGYIHATKEEQPICSVESFTEKPSLPVAESYLASGDYYWNSGMFVTQVGVWLKAINQLNPLIAEACSQATQSAQQDLDFLRVDADAFAKSPADSIDYAVVEKVTELASFGVKLKMIPLDCGWTDLGAWPSVADYHSADELGNVHVGDVISEDSKNTFVMSQQRLVATVGVNNLVVVDTPDAVLVADKDHAQDVKKIVKRLSEEKRDEHLVHRRVYRPWGNYETVDYGERYQVKRIIVNPGASLSLQMHHHRAEHWIVVHGTAEVTCGEKKFLMSENQSTYIPIGTTHRLVNPGKFPLELIEVQSGSYLGEDDIVRFDDVYGREKEKVIA